MISRFGVRDRSIRSISSLPLQMSNFWGKGFSLQQPESLASEEGLIEPSSRITGLSDIPSSHFGCMNFPEFEHQDASMASGSQVPKILVSPVSVHRSSKDFDSAEEIDTLQSLVQSSCSNNNTESFEKNFVSQLNKVLEGTNIVEFQQNRPAADYATDWRQCHTISFQKNDKVENHLFKSKIMNLCSKFQLENQNFVYSHGLTSPASSEITSERPAMSKKKRIRWTQDLHNQFMECVNCLGGVKKATPKGILKLMNCDGLTIFHIKSHLQKYRVAQYLPAPESKEGLRMSKLIVLNNLLTSVITSRREFRESNVYASIGSKMGAEIVEALRIQIDVQRRLYEQLECQRNLQLRIEEQAKELKKMFDLTNSSSIQDADSTIKF